MDLYEASERFVEWLEKVATLAARGDETTELEVEPDGSFWLGRLAPEDNVIALGLGERGERLDPCAIGIRVKPSTSPPWSLTARIRMCVWLKGSIHPWQKSPYIEHAVSIQVEPAEWTERGFGQEELASALKTTTGVEGFSAEVRVEIDHNLDGSPELTISLVNISNPRVLRDGNLYECQLAVEGLTVEPYTLESLPDSFRYDRKVIGYGINCGIELTPAGSIRTVDTIGTSKGRPTYWNVESPEPDISFVTLASNTIPSLKQLQTELSEWGKANWHQDILSHRATKGGWSKEMLEEAFISSKEFEEESLRIATGISLLENNPELLKAFRLMNRSISHSSQGKYYAWRPFQVGFLLANLRSISDARSEEEFADVVWFATGGGKTETYLGLLLTAVFYDRLTGKRGGVTAWSRFPLRMLSLQQTQRFADAIAGAELVRREEGIPGEPFSVGFLVGRDATPNAVPLKAQDGQPDPDDDGMPARYQVLSKCPFCHQKTLVMAFNRRYWRLEHQCSNDDCPWAESGLPFYIVDEEVFRFLPSIVVGTLDKAASIAIQASMRGLVGAPWGRCSREGHGYTYAPRSSRPSGCLVPGCNNAIVKLDMEPSLYGPSFRLQDELHLLRDSLGAVDAHYETLFDSLQVALCGRRPKILASSATLTGYEKQIEALYRRRARVFPVPGPTATEGFWTSESRKLARRFVALAPRGVTLEFAVDRMLTELQKAIRRLHSEPASVCAEARIPLEFTDELLSLYGVDLIYGNTLRDLDAAVRSLETQINVHGPLNTASLTGKSGFDEVRNTLERLEKPEQSFDQRLHVIAASSMMSHGVDVDRLNVMLVLGLPLTTAEFIQATARVGRRWPGLVFVLHKIARERDASVFRSFEKFIQQGDRFVEAVPITRKSRRVLERTLAGVALARIGVLHEPRSGGPLTTVAKLRKYFSETGITEKSEAEAAIQALGLDGEMDELMRDDLEEWFHRFFQDLNDPSGTFRSPKELSPTGDPMLSLRDVEEQAPITGTLKP